MTRYNVANAKKHLSDLLGRVAYGGETILITRRGKPMARLVPAEPTDADRSVDEEPMARHVPGIEITPGVVGGEPRIVRTRIPVRLLVRARQLGATEADILRSYPSLCAEDLVHAWDFYRAHRDEIERQIRDHQAA